MTDTKFQGQVTIYRFSKELPTDLYLWHWSLSKECEKVRRVGESLGKWTTLGNTLL